MKNILCLVLLAGALATQAQTENNSLLSHVPTDADKVYQVNLGTLSSKINWLSIASMMKEHNLGGQHPMNMNFGDMTAILNSGLDLGKDVIITESNAFHADSVKYTTILAHLTDSAKFGAFYRGMKHKDAHIVRYNDKIVVAVITKNPPATTDAKPTEAQKLQLQHRVMRRVLAALHGSGNSSFTADPRVTAAFSDDGDVHIWSRQGSGLESMKGLLGQKENAQLSGLAQMAGKTSTDASIGTLRFETGKITYQNLKLLTPAEKAAVERLSSPGLSSEVVAAIPAGQLMGLVTLHYNIPQWIDSIGKMPMAAMFTGKLNEKGVTLEDFGHALKGSIIVLAYAPDKNTPSVNGKPKMPVVYLLANINDQAAFTKLAGAIKLQDAAAPAPAPAAGDTTAHHAAKVFYATNNGLAVIGGDREKINGFFSHPAATTNPAAKLLTDRANSNSFSLAIDMNAFADFLSSVLTKDDTISQKNQMLIGALRKLDAMHWSAGAIKDDALETWFELRFVDQNKNALGDLIDIFGELAKKKDNN